MYWMLMPLNRYAEFEGRSCRAEYWMFGLFQFLIACVAGLLILATGGFGDDRGPNELSGLLIVFFAIAYLLIFFIPNLAVTIRRWHDLDQSGWMLLLFAVLGAIPILGTLASIANLIWFCMQGTSGPNKYGDDPLDSQYY